MSHDPGLPPDLLSDASPTGNTTSVFLIKAGWQVKMKVDGKVQNYGIYATKEEAIERRNEVRRLRDTLPKKRKRKAPAAPNPLAAVTPVLPPENAVVPDPPPPVAPEARDMRNIQHVKNRFVVTMSICGNSPEYLGCFKTYEEAVAVRNLNWVRRDKLRVQEQLEKEQARKFSRVLKKQKQPQVVWGTIGPESALSWGQSGLSV